MAQSELAVANLALQIMGDRSILAAMPIITDTTTVGSAVFRVSETGRQSLLRMHPWNFATKRDTLEVVPTNAITAIAPFGSTQTTLNIVAHGFQVGDWIRVRVVNSSNAAVDGLTGGPFKVSAVPTVDSVRIFLAYADIDDSAFVAGEQECFMSSAYGFIYSLAQPTSCLRILPDKASPDWKIEGNRVLTDESELDVRFIKDITDYTAMDALFYHTLANWLAFLLCDHLSASDAKKNELHAYLYGGQGKRGILQQSKFVDATEDTMEEMEANDWINARSGGSPVPGVGWPAN